MISREDLVTQSVTDYAKAALVAKGYPNSLWRWVEVWTPDSMEPFDKTVVAAGFNFDDGGRQAELGSDLKARIYHIEFFVFGKTVTLARNIAAVLKFSLESDPTIPLKNYAVAGAPEIDRLIVEAVATHRHNPPDPEPWEEFVWLTAVQVEDIYRASLA